MNYAGMIITVCGGLAFFLFGMNVMSSGLERLAGGKMEQILKKATSNPIKGFFFGMVITCAVQSSSAVTVMLVGLVNSGLMEIGQTVGVIMGSNIGTTVTAWLLSLAGIDSDNFFVSLLKPAKLSALLAFIGILLMLITKKDKTKDIGNILLGFSVLMTGMSLMSGAVEPLADNPAFASAMTAFKNPFLGVLVGIGITGIIQSSAASVGILQAVSMTGSVTFAMALPIIMGQNIGTCVTAVLSCIGVNKNAKKVSVVHITFNLLGTIIGLVGLYGINLIYPLSFLEDSITPAGIAICHSAFNILTTLLLFPFTKQIEKIANTIVRDRKKTDAPVPSDIFIDQRLLNTPSVAVAESCDMANQMALTARKIIGDSIELLFKFDQKKADQILVMEEVLDKYEDFLGSFLVKLSARDLTDTDSRTVSRMLHSIGDFERIGDHAVNILNSAVEMNKKQISFSKEAGAELRVLINALYDILDRTVKSFCNNDSAESCHVEPLEQVIDRLTQKIKNRHIGRLQKGECTIELGFILSDLLNNFERISDHCSNIAVAVIELNRSSFDTHAYLSAVKTSDNADFAKEYEAYYEKYSI